MTTYPILSMITFLPVLAGAAIFVCSERVARWLALAGSLATLAISAPLYSHFDKSSTGLQFVESVPWIPSWNVVYSVGIDGISLPFIFLSTVVSVLCVGASWTAIRVRVREFCQLCIAGGRASHSLIHRNWVGSECAGRSHEVIKCPPIARAMPPSK